MIWALTYLPLSNGKPPAKSRDSFAGHIGHAIEPVIHPLGFNWKIGIGLITSLAARETIVSTLGTIYGVEGDGEHSAGLQQALRHDLTPGGAFALLVFFAFAHAMHVHRRGGAPRNRRLEVAGGAVRLHDRLGIYMRVRGEQAAVLKGVAGAESGRLPLSKRQVFERNVNGNFIVEISLRSHYAQEAAASYFVRILEFLT